MFSTSFYVLKKEPQLPTTSGDPPKPAGRSDLGSYEFIAFDLGSGVCETFKSESVRPLRVKSLSPQVS